MRFKRILVICAGGAESGGPEALHHLVGELIRLGQDAYISYFPYGVLTSTPTSYLRLGVEVVQFSDSVGDLIIFPEVMTSEAKKIKNATPAIWWLSKDHFYLRNGHNKLRDSIRYCKAVVRGIRPLGGIKTLKHMRHFAQSHYVKTHLERHLGFEIPLLMEPINEDFLRYQGEETLRQNTVLFNPAKGFHYVKQLMRIAPGINFQPLSGKSRDELKRIFLTSKIYIDFGHHPGRDRIPREAASQGCIVICRSIGSAENQLDVPIPAKYKIKTDYPKWAELTLQLIESIFLDFDVHFKIFEPYRLEIKDEPINFKKHILKIIS